MRSWTAVFASRSTFSRVTKPEVDRIASRRGALAAYVSLARPDHWFKNVFMLPGVVVAIYIDPSLLGWDLVLPLVIAVIAVGLVASSNYVLNEILDAPTDKAHPVKRHRAPHRPVGERT